LVARVYSPTALLKRERGGEGREGKGVGWERSGKIREMGGTEKEEEKGRKRRGVERGSGEDGKGEEKDREVGL